MDNTSLAPGFLIAPPALRDPNFSEAIVLVASHDETGAMGFILNRETDMRLHSLLEEMSIKASVDDRAVLLGGPVSGFSGFLLYEHDDGKPLAPGISILNDLSISPSRELLQEAALGGLSGRFQLLLGYAGWAPNQLEEEIRRGGWLHAPLLRELIFDVPAAARWEESYASLGVSAFGFMNVPGGAQA